MYRTHGLRFTCAVVLKNLLHYARLAVDRRYDLIHQVDTGGFDPLDALEVRGPHKSLATRYQPTSDRHLRAMFSQLPMDVANFTFVDFGSGKGRALLAASEYPFKQIIGVEFSPELHATSLENVRRFRNAKQRCFHITAVCMDATEFEIPDGPCVFYFFDPFREVVMQRVLSNIARAYQRTRAKMVIMYYAPWHRELIERLGIFRRLPTQPLPFDISLPHQYPFVLFETTPEESA